MTEQSKIDSERARVVDAMCMTWRHDFGLDRKDDELGSCGMTDTERDALCRQMGQLYDHHIAPQVQARASLPVGVPDGYALVPVEPTPEMLASMIKSAHGYDADIVPTYMHLAYSGALAATPTAKAEQSDEAKRIDKQCRDDVAAALGFVRGGNHAWSYLLAQIKECVRVAEAPSLPAAGSAVEEVVVVAWVTPEKDRAITALTEAAAREDGGAMLSSVRPYSVPCMTVAQHERIVAALSAQQSAPERVSVPVTLLRVACSGGNGAWQALEDLRALLASHERGESNG